MIHNFELAWAFREIATLLDVKGESAYKAVAYRKGADILEGLEQQAAELTEAELLEIPGLGKGLAAAINEIAVTGKSEVLQSLRQEVPAGIRQALNLPGVGTKVAHKLLKHLNIITLDDLDQAAREKRIRNIPGLGPKVEVNIQRGIARLKARSGLILLGIAKQITEALLDFLEKLAVLRVDTAGEVRRGAEMVSAIELVIDLGPRTPSAADESNSDNSNRLELQKDGFLEELAHVLAKHPLLAGQLNRQEVAGGYVWSAPLKAGVDLILYLVKSEQYLPALLFQTGSKNHWEQLAALAAERGVQLGPREFGEQIDNEADLYAALGLPFIAPELRENQGEIEAAKQAELPALINMTDLKGDLHLHSKWSDGVNSIEELVEAARNRGYEYIAVTDHSRSLVIARGLKQEKLEEQQEKIAELNKSLVGFRIFSGIELDILADGSLDYPDEVLSNLDLVIGSIHSGFQQDGEKLTKRILGAIQNPHVDIIAHPTGRVLGKRDPYAVDIQAVIEAAAKYNTALEINASPDRLDLKAEYCRLAKENGVRLAINTDAHDARTMSDAEFGVTVARKGWLEPGDVLNTWPVEELTSFLQHKS